MNRFEFRSLLIIILSVLLLGITRIYHAEIYVIFEPRNFLALHTIFEFFSIMVSFAIAFGAWMFLPNKLTRVRLYIGAIFLSIGIIDLLHTLSYKGMPFFITDSSAAKATWFWILARLTESILLLSIFFVKDHTASKHKRYIYYGGSLVYSLMIAYFIERYSTILPVLIVDGQGTTLLKNSLEYLVSAIHISISCALIWKYRLTRNKILLNLIVASCFLFLSEFIFTLYRSVYDVDNMLGHIYKVIGYFYLLRTGYYTTVENPMISTEQTLHRSLHESRESFKNLIEASPYCIMILKKNQIIYINEEGTRLLGAQQVRQIMNRNIESFVSPKDQDKLLKQVQNVLSKQANEIQEQEWLNLYGEKLIMEVNCIPIIYDGELVPYIIGRDITEWKKSQEKIQQSEKLAVVGELAAGIAHEIRNPLTSLKGFVQLIESGYTKPQFFTLMHSEIDRISLITSELLVLSKPQPENYEVTNLVNLIDQVICFMESEANMKNIVVQHRYALSEIKITCVVHKIKQVLVNTIKNAIDAMEHGGTINIQTTIYNNLVRVQVVDHGCGIPEEVLPKLGTPFLTTKQNGTGLGVMVSCKIIKDHKGKLEIQSERNKGTAVTFYLPLHHSGEDTGKPSEKVVNCSFDLQEIVPL